MYQQLLGNNAAAIFYLRTGLRFMNDLATYEIFWHFLYLTVLHGVELTADGKYSKAGDRVTPELFVKLLDERRETVKELFKKLGTVYEKTNAELVLSVLKRQVVEQKPDGRLVPQPRWISTARGVASISKNQMPTERRSRRIFRAMRELWVGGARLRFVYDAREDYQTAPRHGRLKPDTR